MFPLFILNAIFWNKTTMIIFFIRIFQALKLSETELEESGRLSRLSALSDGEKRYVPFDQIFNIDILDKIILYIKRNINSFYYIKMILIKSFFAFILHNISMILLTMLKLSHIYINKENFLLHINCNLWLCYVMVIATYDVSYHIVTNHEGGSKNFMIYIIMDLTKRNCT